MRSVFLLASLVSATFALPPVQIRESFVTVPIAAHVNTTGIHNVLEADRARARRFLQKSQAETPPSDSSVNTPVVNNAFSYIASVGVGTPPTQYNLIVDTGSSNTWVGAMTAFKPTSSSKDTGQFVSVSYGSGSFIGREWTDTVTLAPNLVINQQGIGVASLSRGIRVDGILGLGPTDLTVGTLSPNITGSIPTVVDNLFSQGTIPTNIIGVSFEPLTSNLTSPSQKNGEITFGGVDSSKFTGPITFVPITKSFPTSRYWGIDQSITFGNTTILPTTAGIVDTGATLILLNNNAFALYQQATGGVIDNFTGLLRVTAAQFNNLPNLDFHIGGTTFSLTPNAQAWPRALNGLINGNANSIYLIVNSLGSSLDNPGFNFVNGQTFLERFYSVYDTANKRVGIATTPFTNATTN